jgi:hypothetical protein
MPIGFEPGGSPVQPYELQRMTEDALVEASTLLDQEHDEQGMHTDVHVDSIESRTAGTPVIVNEGLRFTLGPWLLEEDGNPNTTYAAIRPTSLTADQNDYNPAGLSSALVVELESTAARTITGITQTRVRRWLQLVNRGNYTITLAHDSSSSTAAYRFAFSGSEDFELRSGGLIWLYYDTGAPIWRGEGLMGTRLYGVRRNTITIGAGNTSNTSTLSPALADTSKCELRHLGANSVTNGVSSSNVRVEITNTTTVTAIRSVTDEDIVVGWELTEWL